MSGAAQIDYDALAKKYGAISSQAQTSGTDYDALAKQYGATSSQPNALTPPPAGQVPIPAELQPGMVLTRKGPMKYSDAVRSQEPGIAEEAQGFGTSAGQTLKDSGRAAAMGASTLAPIMTGGASLPIQSAVSAASGAADAKLSGGSNTSAGISAAIGGALPFLGPLVGKVASRMLPSFLRGSASTAFNAVSDAAGSNPVNPEGAGQAVLEAQQLQDVGRQMPRTMTKFIQRVTAPNAAPLTYDEARKFYSAASDLSAAENSAMSGAMRRQLNLYKNQLGQAIEQTTSNAGMDTEYGKAMADWQRAAKLEKTWGTIRDITVKRAIPYALGALGGGALAGAGYGAYKEFKK